MYENLQMSKFDLILILIEKRHLGFKILHICGQKYKMLVDISHYLVKL